ncbi:hypothetical protein [Micromonospora parva]|uniref:hypothetical protein n=1 Tax=Micromonospora parva TaxID=1464048 RepID=UPI0033EB9C02
MSFSSSAADLPPALGRDVDESWRRIQRYLDTGEARSVTSARARVVADRLWRRVVEHPDGARPEPDPRVAAALAAFYWFRHQTTGGADPTDLNRSLPLFRQLSGLGNPKLVLSGPMERMAEEDAENELSAQLNRTALRLLSNGSQDARARQEVVALLRRAVEHAVPCGVAYARVLTNLAGALLARYRVDKAPDGLREAVETARRALDIECAFGVDRAAVLANYAMILVSAAEVPGLIDDALLRSAVAHARGAVLSLRPAEPPRAAYEVTLVSVARSVFERTGRWSDLETALDLADEHPPLRRR